MGTLGSFADRKFVHGTWLDFFETYIVPSVSPHIVYNAPVRSIDYSGDAVIVRTHDAEYTADAVIVTAPLPMIKNGTIAFVPALPRHKARAARDSLSLQGEDLRRYILGELDVMFSNKATPHYVKHVVQDWSRESYIRGAYLRDHESWRAAATLSEPVRRRQGLYLPGTPTRPVPDWGNVHDAARAVARAVRSIVC